MNYIEKIKEELQKEYKFPKEYIGLLDFYALLVLIKGKECTNEDVHDAWSIWQNKTMPEHKSLIPFKELSKEVQDLDTKYRDIIIKVTKNLKLN